MLGAVSETRYWENAPQIMIFWFQGQMNQHLHNTFTALDYLQSRSNSSVGESWRYISDICLWRLQFLQDQSRKLECEVDRIHYLQNDALRRDFTINSLYCGIDDLEVLDPTGLGRQDLNIRIIRSVTDPCLCFKDDPQRKFRAIRLAIFLNAQNEDNTWGAILNKGSSIKLVARERVKEELTKILTNDKWTDGFILLKKSGLLHYVSPIMDDCITDLGVNTLSERFKMASNHKSLELDSMKLKVTLLAAYLFEMTIRQAKYSLSKRHFRQLPICKLFNVKQKDMVQ